MPAKLTLKSNTLLRQAVVLKKINKILVEIKNKILKA